MLFITRFLLFIQYDNLSDENTFILQLGLKFGMFVLIGSSLKTIHTSTDSDLLMYMVCPESLVNVPFNKQNRRWKQINFIGLQNNRHPSQHTVRNIHKASGNCQQRPI
jgi:hypothetical protein